MDPSWRYVVMGGAAEDRRTVYNKTSGCFRSLEKNANLAAFLDTKPNMEKTSIKTSRSGELLLTGSK